MNPARKVRVLDPEFMKGQIVTLNGDRFKYPGNRFWVYPVLKKDGSSALITVFEEIAEPSSRQPMLFSDKELLELNPDSIWEPGRVFVFQEQCQVEYFCRWEYYEGQYMIRSFCGGLRDSQQCRPLDYVCDPKYLTELAKPSKAG